MKSVYTAADLPEVAGLRPVVRLGVVGNPIAHSISPPMQQAALDAEGREITYIRLLCEREEGAFRELIQSLRQAGFIGVNVTVPFKREARAVASEADALSTLCGAANTLVFHAEGIRCYNTDGPGFERAIEELSGKRLRELRILLLGACGGAGAALAAQCVLAGCPQLTLANRPRPELKELAHDLGRHGWGSVRTVELGTEELREAAREADLIVNATSLGLAAGDPMPLAPEFLRAGQIVYDLITHDTPLRRAATERGCLAATGQSMLLWQGALAYQHWFGVMPSIEAMRLALNATGA